MIDNTKNHILIVDDEKSIVKALSIYLNSIGFKVSTASNGKDVLKQLEIDKPELILLDIMIPDMDGFEICHRVKNNPETKDIIIIFMTALTDSTDKVKGFEVGAADYISKPFHHREVSARINTHLTLNNLQNKLIAKYTKLHSTMKLVEQSKQLLQRVIDNTPDWICVKDKDFRYILVNTSFASNYGMVHQQVINKNDIELGFSEEQVFGIPSKNIHGFRHDDERVLNGETIHNTNDVFLDSDGKTRIFDTYKIPLKEENEEIFAILTISRDITEQKRLEDELKQYRQHLEKLVTDRTHRLELIANLSRHLNAIFDLDKLLIELVKEVKENLRYDYVQVYLIDEETGDLVMKEGTGEDGQRLKENGYCIPKGQSIASTVAWTNNPLFINNLPEASSFLPDTWLPNTKSELAVPLHKGDDVIGVLDVQCEALNRFTTEDVFMVRSIADQASVAIDNAQLLAERQATIVKLRELDRAKSQFLTMMSHELRTPLNSILGFADLLLLGISGDLSNDIRNDVQLIYNSGQHLLAIINDVLDISKIEAGMIELVLEPLDVRDVINDVLAAASVMVQDKPVEVKADMSDDLPDIYADRTRLKQILLNLVDNAIKFTSKGNVIIKVCNDTEPNNIRFSVKDTGTGIMLEKQKDIFEQFQQADMSNMREYGGIGLGLAICQRLVLMHEGKIGVKSQTGVGSEFFFTIPIGDMS